MTRPTIYLIEKDFGRLGKAYLETDEMHDFSTDPKALAREIAQGQFEPIVSIHRVDFAAGTVTDVTDEIMGAAETMRENAP